ncbi:hypothetical protein DV738_g1714, partial [Chaetothyriales sp. CBS 135597]
MSTDAADAKPPVQDGVEAEQPSETPSSGPKEFTSEEVATHSTKKDLWFIVHGKVYDSTAFADEHPGGEEVLIDVGGQDATEAFEDVGHSDEAREILEAMLVGNLKGAKPAPGAGGAGGGSSSGGGPAAYGGASESGFGFILYIIIFIGGIAAYIAYQYLQPADGQEHTNYQPPIAAPSSPLN